MHKHGDEYKVFCRSLKQIWKRTPEAFSSFHEMRRTVEQAIALRAFGAIFAVLCALVEDKAPA